MATCCRTPLHARHGRGPARAALCPARAGAGPTFIRLGAGVALKGFPPVVRGRAQIHECIARREAHRHFLAIRPLHKDRPYRVPAEIQADADFAGVPVPVAREHTPVPGGSRVAVGGEQGLPGDPRQHAGVQAQQLDEGQEVVDAGRILHLIV